MIRKHPVAAIALAYCAALIAIWFGVSRWARLRSEATFDGGTRSFEAAPVLGGERVRRAVFSRLRSALVGDPAADLRAVSSDDNLRFEAVATVYCGGHATASLRLRWDENFAPRDLFADPRLTALTAPQRRGCRLKLDILRGRGPVITSIEALFAVSFVVGIDGLGFTYGEREILFLPDELLAEGLVAGYHPLPQLDLEAGLDVRAALRTLATRVGADANAWSRTPHRIFRFRTESYIEPVRPDDARAPLPVLRGNTPGPALDDKTLTQAALDGAHYLVRHLHQSGRYNYEYDTTSDQEIPDAGSYSLPRHAGATYFLAQAAGRFGEPALRDAAARALAYLATNQPDGCDRSAWACVGLTDERRVDLGSTALALLAAAEYQRQTGDARFEPWARRLGAFIQMMQKPDGDFCHIYDLDLDARDEATRLLYFSGEATFALAKLAKLGPAPTGAPTAPTPLVVARALRFLTEGAYAHFAGSFYFGEDHWTCLALDEAWADLPDAAARDRHEDFCEGFARFIDRSRFHEGEGPTRDQPDLVGAYGFTPLIAPHPTPVGSRSEALISIYRMALRRGHMRVAREIRDAVRSSMRLLLADQVRDDNAWLMARPDIAKGGLLMSAAVRTVRIDFVQHACSAMLRASTIPDL